MNFSIFFLVVLVTSVICDDAVEQDRLSASLLSNSEFLELESKFKTVAKELGLSEEDLTHVLESFKKTMKEGRIDQESIKDTVALVGEKVKNFLQRASEEDIDKFKNTAMGYLAPIMKTVASRLQPEDKEALKASIKNGVMNVMQKAGIKNEEDFKTALKTTMQRLNTNENGDKSFSMKKMKELEEKFRKVVKDKPIAEYRKGEKKEQKMKFEEMFKNKITDRKDDSSDWARVNALKQKENARARNGQRRQGGPMNKRKNRNMKRGRNQRRGGQKQNMNFGGAKPMNPMNSMKNQKPMLFA